MVSFRAGTYHCIFSFSCLLVFVLIFVLMFSGFVRFGLLFPIPVLFCVRVYTYAFCEGLSFVTFSPPCFLPYFTHFNSPITSLSLYIRSPVLLKPINKTDSR